MKTIKPQNGDIVEWNGSCPLINEVINVLPDGVVLNHCGKRNFVPNGGYRVVGETRYAFWYFKIKAPIKQERISEGLWEPDC